MDIEKIKKRWSDAWEAKQDELDRIYKSYLWLYEFERHLIRGEEGDGAYRFPEVMGYVLRRFNEFLQVLPEARVKGTSDGAIGLQAAIDHQKIVSNLDAVKQSVIASATAFGNEALFLCPFTWRRKGKDGKEWVQYSGLTAEQVDWRTFFPAPGFKKIQDHTGVNGTPHVFRTKKYHFDTFKDIAERKGWKIDGVQPTTWDNANIWGAESWLTTHETQEVTSSAEFVTVLEYWDVVNDEMRRYASGGIEIDVSEDGVPFKHKQLPFHHYRNTYRIDSLNAIGEIEMNLPYNLFREKMFNLMIDDAMLQVQRPIVADGEINFNAEEHEIQPGAIFTVKGVGGGKLQDHIMPLQLGGGISGQVSQLFQMIENSRIAVTSDDTTALYSNPNQLATQTMAKMQSLNKAIDGATKRNVLDTEYYLVNQIAEFIKNELSEPYEDGKVIRYHKVKIKGYDVLQSSEEDEVKFKKGYGASGEFNLNEKTSEMFADEEIEVVPALKDEELKKDQTEKLTMFLQTLFQTVGTLAQVAPQLVQKIFKDMDFPELVKVQLKNLGLNKEMQDVFPVVAKEKFQLDAVDTEHDQIMAGIVPPIREDEDSLEEYSLHLEFSKSKFFEKNANQKAKDSMKEHLLLTIENAQLQIAKPVADRQKELEGTQEQSGLGQLQNNAEMVGGPAAQGGATPPVPPPQGGMEQGLPGGAAQPMPPVS